MHDVVNRGNKLLSYTLTVMAVITGACALSTRFVDYSRPSFVASRRIEVRSIPNFSAEGEITDLAAISFDVNIDLTDVFNWNVKQLFVYLTAEYSTEDNEINQVVLWDRIIERGENAVVNIRDVSSKYLFWDDGQGMRKQNLTLFLSWNVIPVAGAILDVASTTNHQCKFPSVYKLK